MSAKKNTSCDSDITYEITITNNSIASGAEQAENIMITSDMLTYNSLNSNRNKRNVKVITGNNLTVTIDNDEYSPVIPQYAQKCAWCNKSLYFNDDVDVYNGTLNRYNGWMCHKSCNY